VWTALGQELSDVLQHWSGAGGITTKVEQIIGHLGAALMQAAPNDDQIIIDHVRKAHEIAIALRRQQ
jgi:hypothetical protein